MDGRAILSKNDKINVFLETETFIDLLSRDNRIAKAILRYYDSEFLELVRNPQETDLVELTNITQLNFIHEGDELKTLVIIKKEELEASYSFGYKRKDILEISKIIYNKKTISDDEYYKIQNIFIQARAKQPVRCPHCRHQNCIKPLDDKHTSWSYQEKDLMDPVERWFNCLNCGKAFRTHWGTMRA